jgi:hypothetical protein
MRIMQRLPSLILFLASFPHLSIAADGTQRISVGDHSLFLDCSGSEKGPTIILLAGAGMDATTVVWDRVQPESVSERIICNGISGLLSIAYFKL